MAERCSCPANIMMAIERVVRTESTVMKVTKPTPRSFVGVRLVDWGQDGRARWKRCSDNFMTRGYLSRNQLTWLPENLSGETTKRYIKIYFANT